jgi:hypothetical protein
MKVLRLALAALPLLAALAAPAARAAVFSFDNVGVALPGATCPPPPALPVNCNITALGTATVTAGDVFGPWSFTSVFSLGTPLSPTTFATTGTFSFDDTSAANNDFFGSITGVFDVTNFSSAINYVITGGLGTFLNAKGFGTGLVFITPQQSGPPTYAEKGRMTVPEPGTLGLLAAGTLLLAGLRRRAR